jgi:hypothetical protein
VAVTGGWGARKKEERCEFWGERDAILCFRNRFAESLSKINSGKKTKALTFVPNPVVADGHAVRKQREHGGGNGSRKKRKLRVSEDKLQEKCNDYGCKTVHAEYLLSHWSLVMQTETSPP